MQIAFNIVSTLLLGGLVISNGLLYMRAELALDHIAWMEDRMTKLESWPEITDAVDSDE